jgi:hypothetical protein
MPGAFDVTVSNSGDWLLHEDADPSKKEILRMRKDSYYFDSLENSVWNPEFDGFALTYP